MAWTRSLGDSARDPARALYLSLFAAMALTAAPGLLAQTVISWNATSGSWSDAADWSPSGAPNSSADAVTIGRLTSGSVTLDENATVGDLNLNSGYTLQFATGMALMVQGASGTNGALTLNAGATLDLELIGDSLSASGALTNAGQINLGATGAADAAAVSAGALINTGVITVTGYVSSTQSVASTLTITGSAFNPGIALQPFPAVNTGTLNVTAGGAVHITGNYGNFGTTNLDTSGAGGSVLTVSGVLSNIGSSLTVGPDNFSLNPTAGVLSFGNSSTTGHSNPTTVTAAGLNNFGTLSLTGTTTAQTLLTLTGSAAANPFLQPPGMLNAGTYNLTNDAVLQYNGPGISGIAGGVAVNLSGTSASITTTSLVANTASGTNSAFNTLGGNAGTLTLANGASVSTNSGLDLINQGSLSLDSSQHGGSSLGVGGTFQNATGATLQIGNSSITAPTTVTAAGLVNYGTISITGSQSEQALLSVTGPASASPFLPSSGVLGSGSYTLTNNAVLQYSGPGISAITIPASINLNGAGASINATGLTANTSLGTNSALNTLTSNAGSLQLANGAAVSTNAGLSLTNAGQLLVDQSGSGGSSLSIGGGLTNTYGGVFRVGSAGNTSPTSVTINGPLTTYAGSGFSSVAGGMSATNGTVALTGGTSTQATINVQSAAPSTLTGNYQISNDALLEYASGGITAIAGVNADTVGSDASSLVLNGANARVALAGSTTFSSALTGLASNAGTLTIIGSTLSTNSGVNFINAGILAVDTGGSGGSTVNFGGTLANTGQGGIGIGNASLTASTTVTAGSLYLNTLSGSLSITGDTVGQGTKTAALLLSNGITSIASGAALELFNGNGFIGLGGKGALSNNALSTLSSNEGSFQLADGATVSTAAGINLSNDGGSIGLDASTLTSGGSTSLSIGGTLTNNLAQVEILNNGSNGTSTAAVTAAGLINNGTIDLQGYSSNHTATLTVTGNVTTTGTLNIGNPGIGYGSDFATLTVGGTFAQMAAASGGTTTVNGTLTAPGVDINSGVLQGSGTVNGNVTNQEGAIAAGIAGSRTPAGLAISGNYTQGGSGVTYQLINGISNGQFGSLNIGGNATLGGMLDITTPYGYAFAAGQTYDIINITSTTGKVNGAFSGLEYNGQVASGPVLNIGGGLALNLIYNGNDVVLSVGSYTPAGSANIWNSGSGTWSAGNTSSWTGGAIPTAASDVIIGNGAGGTVTLDSSVSPSFVNSLGVNNGYTLAFGAANQSLTLNTSANVSAGGQLQIANSGDTLTTGQGGSNGNLNNFGTVVVGAPFIGATAPSTAALKLGGGGIFTNAGTLTVQNGATLAVAGDFLNGTPGAAGTAGTASFEQAGASTIGGNLVNNAQGALNIDESYASIGGSTLTVAGTLTNAGDMQVGNETTTAPVTINVGSFVNNGSITIKGGSTQFYQAANVPSALNISGTWIPSSGALNTGYYSLVGDAQIQYAGPGISTIGGNAYLNIDGVNASVQTSSLKANASSGLNSALNTLATINGGILSLADGAQVQTNAGLNLLNNGVLEVDATGAGGSSFTVGGVLTNNRAVQVGSIGGGAGTLTVAGLVNTGTVAVEGGTGAPSVLAVSGAPGSFIPLSGALTQGYYSVDGNAILQYAGPGITSIGGGVTLTLQGANASIAATNLAPITSTGTNSALNTLTLNAGSLTIGEAVVATNPGLNLTNTGSIVVSQLSGTPSLTVGGTLINSGTISVGVASQAYQGSATLSAAGLSNSGLITISGSDTQQALVDITGIAAANPFVSAAGVLSPGIYTLTSNAELEYAGPGIASVAAGTTVSLISPMATINASSQTATTANGTNSAFNTLASNAGYLYLNTASISTQGGLLNTGYIALSGGSPVYPYVNGTLSVAGTLVNAGGSPAVATSCWICLSSGGVLTTNGIVNSSTMSINGGAYSDSNAATVNVSGTVANSGAITVDSGAQFSATGAFTNAATGVLRIAPDGGVTNVTAAGFTNLGTVSINNGVNNPTYMGSLTVSGSGNNYTQSGPLAVTTLNVNGALTAPSVNLNGGLLRGDGIVNGNVTNSATVIALTPSTYGASAPGLLTINGNYTQSATGVLDELVQAPPVTRGTDFGAINVSGAVQLGGILDITALNAYTFAANQTYDIMNVAPGALTGTFSGLELNNLAVSANGSTPLNIGGGLALAVVYNNATGEVELEVESAQGPPATDTWIGGADVWTNGVEWSTGLTPTSAQNVVIGTGSAGGTVTYNVASSTINSLSLNNSSDPGYTLGFNAGETLTVTNGVSNAATIRVENAGATLTSGGVFNNSGGLSVANGGMVSVGSKAAPADFINTGTIYVDFISLTGSGGLSGASTGGSSVLISGTLNNTGGIRIGNDTITSQALVSAASLSTTSGASTLSNTLDGQVLINGQNPGYGSTPAVLQLGTSITSILGGGNLTLANANSFITTDAKGPFTNDGIAALTSNAGILSLSSGASATIAGNLTNTDSGHITLSTYYSYLQSGAPVTGDLNTTLNVGGLSNSGQLTLSGCNTVACTGQALLNVTGPAGSFAPGGTLSAGFYTLSGNAAIQYVGPGIANISAGANVNLSGGGASIQTTSLTPNNAATNSAFNTLAGNAGTLSVSGASMATNAGLDLSNSGTITVNGGNFSIGGTLNNYSGTPATGPGFGFYAGSVTLAGLNNLGYIEAGEGGSDPGTFTITGGASNSGVLLIADTAQIAGVLTNTGSGNLSLGGLVVQGEFTATGNGSLSVGGLNNTGAVNLYAAPGSTGNLTVTGSANSYTQTGATAVTLVGGNLTAPAININGGLLQGNGLITGAVTNAASFAPGAGTTTPGLLTINGSYTQTSAGALGMYLQGVTTRGTDYSALNIGGAAALAGALNITAANTSLFAADQSFDIINMTPNQLSGTFDTLSYGNSSTSGTGVLAIPGGNLALAIEYDGSSGEVLLDVVTPDNWKSGTGNWSNAANWSIGLPGRTQLVVLGTGAGGTVTLDQNTSIFDLTVEAGTSSGYKLAFNPAETMTTAGNVDIAPGGEVDVTASGAKLVSNGDLTNAGTLHLESGGSVTVGVGQELRNLDNPGVIILDSGAGGGSVLNVSGTLSNAGGQISIGNSGMASPALLSATGFSGNTLSGSVSLVGNPVAAIGATATLQLQQGITGIADGGSLSLGNSQSFVTLTGGSGNSALTGLSTVAGTLQLENGSAVTTSGDLTIASTGSVGVDDAVGNTGGSSLSVGGAIKNNGSFAVGSGSFSSILPTMASATSFNNSGTTTIGGSTLAAGATFAVHGAVANTGVLTIQGNGLLNITGASAYTQSGGTTTVGTATLAGVGSATLTASGGVTLTGGTLQGTGTINGNVSNIAGTVMGSPDGASPGTLTINGSYSQTVLGNLGEIVGGTPQSGLYGVLSVRGAGNTLTLGGTLDITSTNAGVSFLAGQTYDILNFPTDDLSGSFATLEYGQCPSPNCVTATGANPLIIDVGGTQVALLLDYENTLGRVFLDVETPPPAATLARRQRHLEQHRAMVR